MEGKVRSNMPTFSISENNENLLSNCSAKQIYEILNKKVKFNISIYRHLQKCLYKELCHKIKIVQ